MPLLNRPSADISAVPPRSMPDRRSADPWERVRAWRLRYVPVRAALVVLLAIMLGLWVARNVIPTVSADEMFNAIRRHTVKDGTIAVWLRLCTAQFPLYILLFCAGLTRFSGALTNGVLLVSGMTDGATLALLWHAAGCGIAPSTLPVVYLLRAVAETALRVCMAIAACRLARRMDDRDRERAGNRLPLRLIARYIATFAVVIAAVAVTCFGYSVLAF